MTETPIDIYRYQLSKKGFALQQTKGLHYRSSAALHATVDSSHIDRYVIGGSRLSEKFAYAIKHMQ